MLVSISFKLDVADFEIFVSWNNALIPAPVKTFSRLYVSPLLSSFFSCLLNAILGQKQQTRRGECGEVG
jgi:hypothetical protein